ncbi:MAG: MBL fold metallo-hydrolase [Rhodothermales bacterium]
MKTYNIKAVLFLLAVVLALPGIATAQRNFDDVQIEATQVADNIYMLTGSGGNIGVIIGEDGTFIIDDQFAPLTDKITAAIAALTDNPVKFVLNTHWHGDHTGGNENFGKAGALIVAHDNVRVRMSAKQLEESMDNADASAALPVVTFAQDVTFHLNGETIHAFHINDAHTDGDVIIHFKNANVMHMGDTFFAGRFPYIDLDSGGSIDGMISSANRVLSLTDDDTKIIPGHGPLSTPKDLKNYRDVMMKVRAKIMQMVREDKTLEEVIAANPTDGYEDWGTGFINSERFITIIYTDLSSK